jgi:SAM-dependent methyltransferase
MSATSSNKARLLIGKRADFTPRLEDYETLKQLISKYCPDKANARILNLGCGNSTLPSDMYDDGYRDIENVDISKVVIDQMQRTCAAKVGLSCKCCIIDIDKVMDCRNLQYETEEFDFVVDKSTLDALLCGERAFMNAAVMLKECQRVLKTGGVYMIVTYGKPSNRLTHLQRGHLGFDIKQFEISNPYKQEDAVHYIFILTKLDGANELAELEWPKVEQELETLELAELAL